MSEREAEEAELAPGERRMAFTGEACEIMSEREPEEAKLAPGERRMAFTGEACEMMSEREAEKAWFSPGEDCDRQGGSGNGENFA